MKNICKSLIKKLDNPYSLKNRLAIVLVISSLIPLVLIGSISAYTIAFEIKNRVKSAIQSNLKQVRINMENSLNNLDYVSKQLAYSGTIAEKFTAYMEGENIYDKYLLNVWIKERINLISNTNPNTGIILYCSKEEGEVLFSNDTVIKDFNPLELPLFIDSGEGQYYGPYPSANKSVNSHVFSIMRKMDSYLLDDCYVYIETNPKILERLLNPAQYFINTNHILTDYNGKIVYNSGGSGLKVGSYIDVSKDENAVQEDNDYYYFNERSHQGWNIFAIISKRDFDRALNQWLIRFILLSALSLFISLLFALMVWRMIYTPMRAIRKEIFLMSESNYSSELKFTRILEFDELLNEFYYMKLKVLDLISEVEKKERTKRHLEVEKLMHQINPHFLHNTLNTVQWLARRNGQTQIAWFIALLTKVLHYNMGKEGMIVTIGEEIDVLKAYVELQKFRYDYKFKVEFNVEKDVLDVVVPRFILQPLVENALYHGLNCEEGFIKVEVIRSDDKIRVTVTDNGVGMDENEIKRDLNEYYDENKKVGLGIGISYVHKMIKVNYGDKGVVDIHSKPGETKFIIEIPYRIEMVENKTP